MAKLIVEGGKPLRGGVTISGAKNAALKVVAASLLTDKPLKLENIPKIGDLTTMLRCLAHLGVSSALRGHSLTLRGPKRLRNTEPPSEEVGKIRASIILAGPLLARRRLVRMAYPGGDQIGARPLTTHFTALRELGAKIAEDAGGVTIMGKKLQAASVVLREQSVTATELVLLTAALLPGKTKIVCAAQEPEIVDLARLLSKMGARIQGAGTSEITIIGVPRLGGAHHRIIPDRIEAASFAIAAAATRGEVEIAPLVPDHLASVLARFRDIGVHFALGGYGAKKRLLIFPPTASYRPTSIETRPYPGFPTDLHPPLAVLLTQASGKSTVFESMFESRFGYLRDLARMGARLNILDGRQVEILGPTPLYGRRITSFDIRAGATLIIAALVAKGRSEISGIEQVDRGYEAFDVKLARLGAEIERV